MAKHTRARMHNVFIFAYQKPAFLKINGRKIAKSPENQKKLTANDYNVCIQMPQPEIQHFCGFQQQAVDWSLLRGFFSHPGGTGSLEFLHISEVGWKVWDIRSANLLWMPRYNLQKILSAGRGYRVKIYKIVKSVQVYKLFKHVKEILPKNEWWLIWEIQTCPALYDMKTDEKKYICL